MGLRSWSQRFSSTSATRGSISGLRKLSLTWCSVDPSTALRVTSLPVPAVVGTAMNGGEPLEFLEVAGKGRALDAKRIHPWIGASADIRLDELRQSVKNSQGNGLEDEVADAKSILTCF
jgi:hypothetical protein